MSKTGLKKATAVLLSVAMLLTSTFIASAGEINITGNEIDPDMHILSISDELDANEESGMPEENGGLDYPSDSDNAVVYDKEHDSEADIGTDEYSEDILETDMLEIGNDDIEQSSDGDLDILKAGINYNIPAAVAYAREYYQPNKSNEQCAGFASRCLQSGGINVYHAGTGGLEKKLLQLGCFAEYSIVHSGKYMYATGSNEGKISVGDVMIFKYSNGDTKHTAFITGIDKNNRVLITQRSLMDGKFTNKGCFKDDAYVGTFNINNHKLSDGTLKAYVLHYTGSSVSKPTAPTIRLKNRVITLTGDAGCTFYYTLDNGGVYKYSIPFSIDTEGNHVIQAYSENSNGDYSDTNTMAFYVGIAPLPRVDINVSDSVATIRMEKTDWRCTILYSINGSMFYQYNAPFTVNSTSTIRYYSTMTGCVPSRTEERTVTLGPPSAPSASLINTSSQIPIGSQIMISLSGAERASSYTLKAIKDNEIVKTVNSFKSSVTLALEEAGDYRIVSTASNMFGESGDSNAVSIQIMPNVKVQFVDHDGSPLSEEYEIPYGGSATPPLSPTREGYNFQGWSGKYENVKEDTVITPIYEIKKFTVNFRDKDGVIVSSQRVEWGSSAVPPDMTPYIPAAGYIFAGWCVDQGSACKDYTSVKGKMDLYASYAWKNYNFPVAISDLDVVNGYNDDGQFYKATMNLVCNPEKDMRGRVVFQLKTDAGQTVAVSTYDVNLRTGTTSTPITVNINTVRDATKASIYVVGLDHQDRTAGEYAEAVDKDIRREIYYDPWTEWSTDYPLTDEGESKTQYRYNIKSEVTRNDTRSLAGYSLISTERNTGNWSGWQDSPVSSVNNDSLYREVETRRVKNKTYYTYGHYCCTSSPAKYWVYCSPSAVWNSNLSTSSSARSYFESHCTRHVFATDIPEDDGRFRCVGVDDTGTSEYLYGNKERMSCTCWSLYRLGSYDTFKTQYRYRDTRFTYHFERISDFTEWSDTPSPASHYQAETRILYRGRDRKLENREPNEINDTNVISLTDRIKTADNFTGKRAVVFVYKKMNTDPTMSQIEAVTEIIIGERNSYSLSFKPKENPSGDTGDFVVAFSIEGATRLVNVDIVKAPRTKYDIAFLAKGETVSTIQVEENGNAAVPDAPIIEGKEFVRWDESVANITEDLIINAEYKDADYEVVFLDEMNSTIEAERLAYYSPIIKDYPEAPEGYEFKKWDSEVVSGDMVVRAEYEKKKHTVTFVDNNGDELDSQTVSYGDAAIPPEYEFISVGEGETVTGWSMDHNWNNVTEDMIVYPVVEYEETTEAPYTFLDSLSLNCLKITDIDEEPDYPELDLYSDTEEAEIYYTTDGSVPNIADAKRNPDSSTRLYDVPIVITDDCIILACASADKKNDSILSEFSVSLNMMEVTSDYFKFEGEEDVEDGTASGNEVPEGSLSENELPDGSSSGNEVPYNGLSENNIGDEGKNKDDALPKTKKHVKAPDTYVAGQKDYEFSQKYFNGIEAIYKYFVNISKTASVSRKGVLKVKKMSSEPVLICAEAESGETISQCTINILDKPKLRFPAFTSSDVDAKIDGYEYFQHDSTRTTAADYWESSNPSVAEADPETGQITIKGKGKTKIIAYFGEKGRKGTLKVKAKLKVK